MMNCLLLVLALGAFLLSSVYSYMLSPLSAQINLKVRSIQHLNVNSLAIKRSQTKLLMATDKNNEKAAGIEPKYLYALGLFIFAALYDFFVTHGGKAYIVHP